MFKRKRNIAMCALIIIITFLTSCTQQSHSFENEIAAFKKQDSLNFPPKNSILFVGSSSFRLWTNMTKDFDGYTIINRGFGGSSLPDVIYYANDIIFPYTPKQIVIYCGDNDFVASPDVTAQLVYNRFVSLFTLIRSKLEDATITYISVKPSPSRKSLMPKMKEANDLIQAFLKSEKKASFVDVYHKMLDESGQPRSELFMADSLHMNAEGYAIWKKEIFPFLVR